MLPKSCQGHGCSIKSRFVHLSGQLDTFHQFRQELFADVSFSANKGFPVKAPVRLQPGIDSFFDQKELGISFPAVAPLI